MVGWLKKLLRWPTPQLGRTIQWAGADWDTGVEVSSGVTVNESTALTYSAVWCATRVICETIGCLPVIVYKRTANGRERADTHALYSVVHDRANEHMNAVTFHEHMSTFLVNWGTAYAEILRGKTWEVYGLKPLHTSDVTAFRNPDESLYFEVRNPDDSSVRRIEEPDMFRVVGPLSSNGVTGLGVIQQARESIGMGVATEQYGAGFFGNGARPGGILSHPGNPTEEAEKRMRSSWEAMHKGPKNSGRVALLREDTKYTPISIPPEDAQFLQTRQHNITEIARWYRLPPHKLGDLTRATFSNIEQQSIDFVVDSIMPWLRRWEAAYNTQLLEVGSPYYVEFLVDGLLRGDTKSRTEALTQQFLNGALTLNEWRAMENRNSIDGEGGDAHFVPLNLVPIDRAMEPPEPAPVLPPDAPDDDPEDESEDEEKPAPPDVEQQQRAIQATAEAIDAEIGRLRVKEANAVRRAANKPRDFLGIVDRFYLRHVETLSDALMHAVRAHRVACGMDSGTAAVVAHAEKLARKHCDEAVAAILAAAECPASALPAAIEALTNQWQTKPYEVAA